MNKAYGFPLRVILGKCKTFYQANELYVNYSSSTFLFPGRNAFLVIVQKLNSLFRNNGSKTYLKRVCWKLYFSQQCLFFMFTNREKQRLLFAQQGVTQKLHKIEKYIPV